MAELVRQGKVRHLGLSNETPYGLMKFLEAAGSRGLPAVASVQNAYNLLDRNTFETSLQEACHYTNTAFLAHSPLAGGALSGKYALETASKENRLLKYPGFTARYVSSPANAAVKAYAEVAEKYGMTPAHLALAWCYTRPFVTSTLIGATSADQMRDNLMAMNFPVNEDMEADIFELYFNKHRAPTTGVSLVG